MGTLSPAPTGRKNVAGGVSRRDRHGYPLPSPEGGGRVDDVDWVDFVDTESEDRCPQRPLRPCRPQRVRGGWAPRLPRGGRARGPAPTLGSAGARGAPGAPPVWRCPSGASSLPPFFLRNTHYGFPIPHAVRAQRARGTRRGSAPQADRLSPLSQLFFRLAAARGPAPMHRLCMGVKGEAPSTWASPAIAAGWV